jgi:phage terminase large subunit GpA-like protein
VITEAPSLANYDIPDVNDASDFRTHFRAFRPFPATRMLSWALENIVTDQGRPYDHHAYPHLAAPGGPMDAFDDPHVRTISEQFATRLGKTFFGLTALLYHVHKDPCPMLLASESQDALKRVVGRMYKMIYQREALNSRLLIRARKDHKQDHIKFKECDIKGAWARSPGSLADMNIKVGLANEIDKGGWDSKSTTKEGAPLKLYDDRFKDYQSVRKIIYECTPTVVNVSRIERLRLAGWNCQYHVPCPHCKKYQVLRFAAHMGSGEYDFDQPGRIIWDLTPAGKDDRDLARRTAKYLCVHCTALIDDSQRAWMMRHGVWVPEGCEVNHDLAMDAATSWFANIFSDDYSGGDTRSPWKGWDNAAWIHGSPARNSPDASYQLSSLYALSLGWGDIASEYVSCKNRPQYLRNFVNQWEGRTWEVVDRKQTWEQLGTKLIDNKIERFTVPAWASIVTVGVDRQKDHFVYVVDAWGPGRTHATIGYGEERWLDDVVNAVCARWYNFEDGGDPIRPVMTLVDSGFRPEGVYEGCRDAIAKGLNVLPCKGSNKSIDSDYKHVKLGKDTSMPGMILVHVDTIRTQAWIDKVLHVMDDDDPGRAWLHAGTLEEHQDFLEQLLNDASSIALDSTNNEREVWERIDTDMPNDFRDCRRYSYVAMLFATRGREIRPHNVKPSKRKAVVSPGASRRDGRSWIS